MDDDKFDKTDPANTPHAFQSVAFSTMGHALSFRGPCKVCKRGSGHHVHDVSPFPEKHPHKYVAAKDRYPNDLRCCDVCGRGSGHALHEEWARLFGVAAPARWVKGAPEPERHAFEPGNVSVEGVGSYCKSCGGLAGNGNVHVLPPDPYEDEDGRCVCCTEHYGVATLSFPFGVCDQCGHMPAAHQHPLGVPEPEPDQTKQELAKTARRYKRERDEQTELVRELLAARSPSARGVPDQINRPEHYTAHPSGIECIQITEHMSFTLGNVVKYVWRADLKGDAVADLEKASWYLRREIDRRNGKITKV